MPAIPSYVEAVFIATVLLTLWLFIKSAKNKTIVTIICIGWLVITGVLAYKGFFKDTSSLPPHFLFAVAPPLLTIILLFVTHTGRKFINNIDLRTITLLSIVRIPVEMVLYWLFLGKGVPELMTFSGRNFDIFSGITALLVYFICFRGSAVTNKSLLLIWNFICLLLLLNIVINAVLSLPFSFQQFAFDQPNIAVLYFPFTWLPSFIVMVVLFSHLVAISRLTKK
ncbi:MAG TPA: hypothetical protein VH396_07300 [Chitinophagaceae bacterium]